MVTTVKDMVKALRASAELVVVQAHGHDRALRAAACLLEPPADDVLPYFYVKGADVYKRPIRNGDNVTAGFRVCHVWDNMGADDVCAILNKGEPATDGH